MRRDPTMVQALALMRAGKMPSFHEIVKGFDLFSISAAAEVQL